MKSASYLKSICLTLLITVTYTTAFAQQPDYFITAKNDTVNCTLKDAMGTVINKDFKYTTATKTKPQKLNTDTVNEFSKNNVVYTKQVLPGDSEKKMFVTWSLRGKINLYTFDNREFNSEAVVHYYIGNEHDELIEIRPGFKYAGRQDRMKAFYDMFANAPQLVTKFKTAEDYSLNAIVSAIAAYNSL
jgi:hypothetical protein